MQEEAWRLEVSSSLPFWEERRNPLQGTVWIYLFTYKHLNFISNSAKVESTTTTRTI